MNRAADEKLRQAVREWLEASPAAGASLHVDGAVFVRVGTVEQLQEVTPRAERAAMLEQVPGLHLVVFDVPGEDPDHPPRPFVIDDERAAGFHREHFLPNHLEPVYRLK